MRNFPNFLQAYLEYAHDNFCPPQFHLWTGLSIISAALERKVWTRQSLVLHYPNIYTLLVSHPAVGKSTALDRGIDLIEELKRTHNQDFKIVPTQASEAALVDIMRIVNSFQIGSTVVQFSSAYFHASEASSSALKNEHGDFNATLTAFYDCPKVFRKKLKGDTHSTEIPNVGFSLLAGTTFDFLKRLVNEDSVMGGLASRFIYVICKDRIIRESKWDNGQTHNERIRWQLISDLAHINQMKGAFKPTKEFISAWEEYQPKFSKYLIDLNSPRMESIMARKPTNLIKICMILSISDSDSMELTSKHWDKGLEIMEEVTADNPFIISSAITANVDSQLAINLIIMQAIERYREPMPSIELNKIFVMKGIDPTRVEATKKMLLDSGKIKLVVFRGKHCIELLGDANAGL